MIQVINQQTVRIVSSPFTIYPGTDLTGTATGDPEVRNYCSLPSTTESRYHLDRPDHNNIFQFRLTQNGTTGFAYCLDKFADGPYGDIPYVSAPFESIFETATERQKQMLAWILANTFPTVSAAQTFALAGVDPTANPPLDDDDAYAAVQVALWVLLGQIAPDEVYFLDCTTDEAHPKSARMRAAVLRLLELAGEFADSAAVPAPPKAANQNCCKNTGIDCCNTGEIPSDVSVPYLVFSGCPNELRTVCGRLLIGPFRLQSGLTGQPSITIEPLCTCQDDFSAVFMDFCGNSIETPSIGDEFYLAVRTMKDYICFTLGASFTTDVTRVVTMKPESSPNYQPIGTGLLNERVTVTAEICVCAAAGKVKEKSCRPGVSIQNNNTSNNNNNNNNNSNSNQGGGMFPYPPCICGYPPCNGYWLRPPYFPEPPYPPYPPYPPELPYPPYPPYPPEPPYPPKPPYPPCPPKPPCPPEPPCPPKPPCPPCPPKPPCLPKPPCCCNQSCSSEEEKHTGTAER